MTAQAPGMRGERVADEIAPDPRLAFEAGKVAFGRGWHTPQLIRPLDLDSAGPAGPPLMVLAPTAQITVEVARTVASLAGVGREICVITDGPLSDAVAPWLRDDVVVYPGQRTDLSSDAQLVSAPTESEVSASHLEMPEDSSWLTPKAADFPDPYCHFGRSEELHRFSQSPEALSFWNDFVASRGLAIWEDQSNPPASWFGRWSLFDQQTDGCLLLHFRPGSLFTPMTQTQWTAYIAIESIIGHVPPNGRALGDRDSYEQRQFANQVTAFVEIPESAAMVSRTFSGGHTASILDLRRAESTAFGEVAKKNYPKRFLSLAPADDMLLVAPQGPVTAPLPAGWSEITLTYLVPVGSDRSGTENVLATCIDAVARTHRLLWNPYSDLKGRRNPDQGPALQAFLDGMGFASYGGAVQAVWDAL